MSAITDPSSIAALTPNGLTGFQGVLRQVGLQEILQLECLGRKSSILEVTTPRIRGRIYICDGSIVHAESGTLDGEVALYGILGLQGGQFALHPYTEPAQRTISGHWEALLMEAARITDEAPGQVSSPQQEILAANDDGSPAAVPPPPARTEEIVLCSGSGELLFDMNCGAREDRRALLQFLHDQVEELAGLAPTGAFDRLQVTMQGDRFLFQVLADRRLLVRTTTCPDL